MNLWKVVVKEGGVLENILKILFFSIDFECFIDLFEKYWYICFVWGLKVEYKYLILCNDDDSKNWGKFWFGDCCVFYIRYKGDLDKDGVYGWIVKVVEDFVYDLDLF